MSETVQFDNIIAYINKQLECYERAREELNVEHVNAIREHQEADESLKEAGRALDKAKDKVDKSAMSLYQCNRNYEKTKEMRDSFILWDTSMKDNQTEPASLSIPPPPPVWIPPPPPPVWVHPPPPPQLSNESKRLRPTLIPLSPSDESFRDEITVLSTGYSIDPGSALESTSLPRDTALVVQKFMNDKEKEILNLYYQALQNPNANFEHVVSPVLTKDLRIKHNISVGVQRYSGGGYISMILGIRVRAGKVKIPPYNHFLTTNWFNVQIRRMFRTYLVTEEINHQLAAYFVLEDQ